MAHIAKYQASALGAMLAHYDRSREGTLARDNIDEKLTCLNYDLAPGRGTLTQLEFIQRRVEALGVKPRKNAVLMADLVLTLPKDVQPADTPGFFQAAFDHLEGKFGKDNVVSAFVHMDEATPHMHFAFVPATEDGRLSARDVVSRNMLQRLHGDLADAVEERIGYRPSILLDDDAKGDKQLSHLEQPEYVEAKRRLESLRRSAGEAAVLEEAGSARTARQIASEARGREERASELERANQGLRDELVARGDVFEGERARAAEAKAKVARLTGLWRSLVRRVIEACPMVRARRTEPLATAPAKPAWERRRSGARRLQQARSQAPKSQARPAEERNKASRTAARRQERTPDRGHRKKGAH